MGKPEAQGGLWSAPWAGVEMLDSARIHRLGVQPGAPGTVFAASWGEGLWFSRDGGRRWSNAAVDIQGSRVHCVAASSTGEGFVGSDHAILKRAKGDLRRWDLLDNLWLVPSSSGWSKSGGAAVRDVAVNPRHEEWLLAAIEGVGVLFSSDGGFSWDDARPNTDVATCRLLWHPDAPTQALALAPTSLRHSDDGGWSWHDSEFPLNTISAAAALAAGRWLIAGRGAKASGPKSELWHGDKGDWLLASRFEPRQGQPEGAIASHIESILAVREEESAGAGAAWLAGWSDGALEVSQDSGRSWRTLLIEGARPERACDLALCVADEAAESEGEEATAQKEAPADERGGARFSLDGKILSSLLDKGRGHV